MYKIIHKIKVQSNGFCIFWLSAWFPSLSLAHSPGPQSQAPICIYRPRPSICIYRPWAEIYIYGSWPTICITSPEPEFAYTDLVPPMYIYWPWLTICITSIPGYEFAFNLLSVVVAVVVVILAVVVISLEQIIPTLVYQFQ